MAGMASEFELIGAIERVIIDAGGVRPSYLGPVESPRIGGGR